MLDSLQSLAALFALGLAAYGIGRPLERAFGGAASDGLETGVWSVAIGWFTAVSVLALLGALELLHRPAIGVVSCAAAFWGLGELLRAAQERRQAASGGGQASLADELPTVAPPPRLLACGVGLLAVWAIGGSFAAALAPPTAADALYADLQASRQMLDEHSIGASLHARVPTALLMRMGDVWALALDGPVTARLVRCGLGLLFALATVLLATAPLGRRWAWIAGALVLLPPLVSRQMQVGDESLGLALFATLAIAAWQRAVIDDAGRRWFNLAGGALGAAIGMNPAGLLLVPVLAVVGCGVEMRRQRRLRPVFAGAGRMTLIALGAAGVVHLGAIESLNIESLNIESLNTESLNIESFDAWTARSAPDAGVRSLDPREEPNDAHAGGASPVGGLLMVMLPGLLIGRRLRGLTALATVAVLYWLAGRALAWDETYFLPLASLACIAGVWAIVELGRAAPAPRRMIGLLLAATLVAEAAAHWTPAIGSWQVAVGAESRDAYLRRLDPSYRASAVVNEVSWSGARLLCDDDGGLYVRMPIVHARDFRSSVAFRRCAAAPERAARVLREAGFTHIVISEPLSGDADESPLSAILRAQMAADATALAPLVEYDFHAADGAPRRYRALLIPEPVDR